MFDLISIGDCVIDTFIPLIDAEIIQKENTDTSLLAMRYGDKIPVEPSISMVAGNAANNAVGAARLGLKTAIYTNVGNKDDDEADNRIMAKFKKEKIDTRYVIENADLPSNHHVVLNFKGERTILIYHQPWKFNLPDLDRSKWVYLTSLSPSYVDSNLVEQIINYVERTSTKLMYQPGTFQLKQGLKKNAKLIALSEVFILNLQEARLLIDGDLGSNTSAKKLLKDILNLGPKKVVITDGGNGSYGADNLGFYKLGLFPAKLLEMTGSGDAYATGLLAGLFHGEELKESMRWGAANGASVVEQIGPQAGLLTFEKMKTVLKSYNDIIAKDI